MVDHPKGVGVEARSQTEEAAAVCQKVRRGYLIVERLNY